MIVFIFFLSFVCGLLAGFLSYFYLFFILIPLFLLIRYRRKSSFFILLFLFLALGIGLTYLYPHGDVSEKELTGIVVEVKNNYYLLLTLHGKYYIYEKNTEITCFSILKVSGYAKTISTTHYESRFDFASYLMTKGVYYQFVSTGKNIFFQPKILYWIKKYLFAYCDETATNVLSSLLFGSSLGDYSSTFSELGIVSALSLSGFHISLLLKIIQLFLNQKGRKRFPLIKTGILLAFMLLSEFRFSMRRLFLLSLLSLIVKWKKLPLSYLTQLSLVAFVLVLCEPYMLLNGAFYYPFPLLFYLAFFPKKKVKGFKSVFAFSIRVFLFYLPYRFLASPSFNLFSPLLQFILLPYSHLLFLLSLLLVIPFVGYLLNPLVQGFLSFSSFLNTNSVFALNGQPSVLFIVLYYSVLIFMETLDVYSFPKQKKYVSVLLIFVILTPFIPSVLPKSKVTFVDVGQGDCTLVETGYQNFLIDTGGNIKFDLAKECLLPFLQKKKIYSLDAVFITHDDYDHSGALSSLTQLISVDNVYTRDDFINAGNTLNFSSFSIQNLNTYVSDSDDNNLNSGVYRFMVKNTTFLIMGDAPKSIEKRLVSDGSNIQCKIIKIGHHGSNTSSDKTFLQAANPSLAIISAGLNNSYGHPHQETLTTLENLNIPYRRTDWEGSISFSL